MNADQIRWIAHLARLEFAPEEIDRFAQQLGGIVAYVDQLKEVNTDGVEPMAHALPISNVFRDDEPSPSFTADEALSNAPNRQGDFFAVPAVLD